MNLPWKNTGRAPLAALEVAFRGLRWASIVVVAAWLIDRFTTPGASVPGVVWIAPLSLLGANLLSLHMAPGRRLGAMVWAQIAFDVIAVVAAVAGVAPASSSPLWAVLAFPVIEGAVRFQFSGAITTWALLALGLFGERITRWVPGEGYEPLIELGYHLSTALALGVVAGYLAEKLADEMYIVAEEHAASERRARLLAVLTVAGQHLSVDAADSLPVTANQACRELGFNASALVVSNSDGLAPEIVAAEGDTPSDSELAAAIAATADVEVRKVARVAEQGLVGVVGRNAGAHMVLWVDAHDADDDRDQAFEVLVSSLATSLATSAREQQSLANERRLRFEAEHDYLTGLLNRAGLLRVAAEAIADPQAEQRLVAFIDLDGFKAVNDSFGHEVGDELLVIAGERLRSAMPGVDVGRLGGDEFVLITAPVPDLDADALATRLATIFDAPAATSAGAIPLAGSVGVGPIDPQLEPGEQWKQADAAMYADKATRRHRRRDDAASEAVREAEQRGGGLNGNLGSELGVTLER